MVIPQTIKIGGIIFNVELVPTEALQNDAGEFLPEKNLIRINKDRPKEQRELSFIHEILHGINYEMDEEKTEFLAQALYQILSDNDMLR